MNAPYSTSVLDNKGPTWPAHLHLHVGKTVRGSRLVSKAHCGPLYVQKAFYPEGESVAHLYLLHPPGGLVSGDNLEINVHGGENAACLLTTPGAGKLYKARQDQSLQQQTVHLTAKDNAVIEWFPQETIVFPGAYGRLNVNIDLVANARTVGWEVMCYGLPASQSPFQHGSVSQRLIIHCDGLPVLIDQLSLDGSESAFSKGQVALAGANATGIMWAGSFNDRPEQLLQRLTSLCEGYNRAGVSFMRGFICLRYLGHSAAEAKDLFVEAWRLIRPTLINKPICPPAIWHC